MSGALLSGALLNRTQARSPAASGPLPISTDPSCRGTSGNPTEKESTHA
jgi:hypothetical protein